MTRAHDLFRPTRLKLLLALTLIIPVFFVLVLVNGFPYSDMVFPAAIAIILSYAAACVIDDTIQSRTVKIAIASVAALISILLGYIFTQSMTMVCDPVHDPGGMVCDPVHVPEPTTTAPTVIATVRPAETTPMIFDPVHQPGGSGQEYGILSGTTTALVAEKLDECLKNCKR
jgi:hypothetical protein